MPNGDPRGPWLGGARFVIWLCVGLLFAWLLYVLNEETGGSVWPLW